MHSNRKSFSTSSFTLLGTSVALVIAVVLTVIGIEPMLAQTAATQSVDHSGDPKTVLQQRLNSQFKLTKITADATDIITPGSVLVLHTDGLVMFSTNVKVSVTSSYKDGKLSIGFGSALGTNIALAQMYPGANITNVPQRKFLAGEKFWVVGETVKDDGVIITVYSDPYEGTRYFGQLKFPFKKHIIPPADEVLKTIAEVVTVESEDHAAGNVPQQASTQVAQSEQALAPIPPPPPPSDAPPAAPKTLSLNQTKDQVVAVFGQPSKVVKLGAKEIDYYPDLKVTFVDGKVTDVQ